MRYASRHTLIPTACAFLVLSACLLFGCEAVQVNSPPTPSVPPAPLVPSADRKPFAIEVVDEQTNRGVPLVELKTVANVRYYTDSAGLAAIDDPVLLNREAFFYVASPGYEFPADGFGFHGDRFTVTPGGSVRLKIKRLNVAERLYRVTGEGIYRDSVLLGRPVPIRQPLLNAQVSGQDSAGAAAYRGKVWWFWGDTMRPAHPLGHFWTAGATSDLPGIRPGQGSLDPSAGVDLNYFTDADGFSRGMLPRIEGKPCWLDGLMVLKDDGGAERLVAKNSIMQDLGHCVGRQLVVLNDKREMFDVLKDIPLDVPLYPVGHPFRVDADGSAWIYCGQCCPNVRFKANWKDLQDFASYEAFTCLAPGSRYDKDHPDQARLDRGPDGKLVWSWKKDTAPLETEQIGRLLSAGRIKPEEVWFRPKDMLGGKPVVLGMGSVAWNSFRKKWVMIAGQLGGDSSFLGEIWYAEADKPEGPWPWARKVVTHDHYSLYNPVQHPFFEQDGGRLIYFEGTYASTFSRQDDLTPRYDYNQMMYRMDLSDPRLELPTDPPPKAAGVPPLLPDHTRDANPRPGQQLHK